VPFAARQVYLQQHAGEAHDFAAMHAQVAPRSPAPSYVPAKAQYPAASGPRPMTAPNAVRQPQPAPYVANPVEPRRPQPAPVATPTPAVAPRNAPAPPRQPTINTQPVAPAPRAAYPEREHEHVARPTPPKPPANPPAPAPADKHTDDSKKKKEHA
jgi:hypothetical protein